MKLIKKTKSFCPVCLGEINADILEKEDGIWMHKECESHGKFIGFIEKDPVFYKKTMNVGKVKNILMPVIMVPVTHRCNLKCKFCYLPNREREDMPLEQFERIVDKLPTCSVCTTGGEPTLIENIFKILGILNSNPKIRNVAMATNGIKLAQNDFVRKLKEAGLGWIIFSFNGFNDKVYRETNSRDLLDIKLQALQNIQEEKIPTAISPTLVRGLNEKDIKPIIEFALDNPYPFYEIRIRAAAKVGVYEDINQLCTSEVLDIVAKSIGLNKEYFLNNLPNENIYHSAHQFNMRLVFAENGSKRKLIYWDHGLYSKSKLIFSKKAVSAAVKIAMHTLLNEGITRLIKSTFSRYGPLAVFSKTGRPGYMDKLQKTKTLNINLYSWPNRHNIDLNENNSVEIKHMTFDGEILNFKEALIRSEEL